MSDSSTPLLSIHTSTFTRLLQKLGVSLVISTGRAGKLIVARADGSATNTYCRDFQAPTGIAVGRHRLAIGTATRIWELHNIPATATRLDPPDKHDACFIPRNMRVTGDIDVREMAWDAEGELWFVNTRFSCLCTLDPERRYSFVPRWRPPFITAYDLSDRCHLNGLGLRDGRPHYATALGKTDTAAGWRANKANGGILMEIPTNKILLQGLSLPHSPRWYADRLWVLESGKGTLAYLDPEQNRLVAVANLPGFTRGLDFFGPYAFVGLSQLRETAESDGMPRAQTSTEGTCGVWVVNWQTGAIAAFLRFEAAVREIFAVSVLPGIRFPAIIDTDLQLIGTSYVLPQEVLADLPQSHLTKGNERYRAGELEAAIASYSRCLELQPDFLTARYNLGVVLGDCDRYEEAITELRRVVAAEADHVEAFNNLGVAYSRNRRIKDAIESYERAIAIRPEFAKARHNLGMTLLQQGDFARGWAESEWRWKTGEFSAFKCPQPRWDGTPLPEQTLLIYTEQGAGDTIQFFRYLPLVAERCQQILLVCPEHLRRLFEPAIPPNVQLQPPGEIAVSAFAAYIPLMSLPLIFQTTLETIPSEIPYLKATPQQLPLPTGDRPRIGLVWGGSPTHSTDRHRSIRLREFLPILQLPEVAFFALQKGESRLAEVSELSELAEDIEWTVLDPQLKDFSDTAAAIAQLDLVISVDTSVAHLAGALGKPVWTLLSYYADWRWLHDRTDSPWYPSMRLFWQPQPGDWAAVLQQLWKALVAEFP